MSLEEEEINAPATRLRVLVLRDEMQKCETVAQFGRVLMVIAEGLASGNFIGAEAKAHPIIEIKVWLPIPPWAIHLRKALP